MQFKTFCDVHFGCVCKEERSLVHKMCFIYIRNCDEEK